MCLGVPGRVVAVEGLLARVDFWGVRREVRLDVVDEPVAEGDWVLNHVGFAIRRIPPEEVEATLGYEIGGICPIPPDEGVLAIVDAAAAATLVTVYCGVGRNDRTLEIGIADLIAAAKARVLPVVVES